MLTKFKFECTSFWSLYCIDMEVRDCLLYLNQNAVPILGARHTEQSLIFGGLHAYEGASYLSLFFYWSDIQPN